MVSVLTNIIEFRSALKALKMKIAKLSLKKIRLSIEDLVLKIVTALIILIVMFIFIFVGIAAFASADSFTSSVNAVLPILAGVFMKGGLNS